MDRKFDRSQEDLGNVVLLEHVQVTVPDQKPATLFYVTGLGLTRDPYLMTGLENMWVNAGRNQFHLLHNERAQVVRGHVGLVLPDRAALLRRLASVKERLSDTRFGYVEREGYVEATCPWGNRIRCFEPDAQRFGRIVLGIPYVEFDVPSGTANAIARFYREAIKALTSVEEDANGRYARIKVGNWQHLHFRETDRPLPEYDNHHLQIYVNDFSGPYRWLLGRNLVSEESDQYQYRFREIVDPENGKPLFTIEHEIRSMTHPLYARPLVNRNPVQTNRNYAPGYDAGSWGMGHIG